MKRDADTPVPWPMSPATTVVPSIVGSYPGMAHATVGLLRRGVNETYRVQDLAGSDYILKEYRAGFHVVDEVLAEVSVLSHLAEAGLPVGVPVPDGTGRFVSTLSSVDGERPYALFRAVPGTIPSLDDTLVGLCGELAASCMKLATGWASWTTSAVWTPTT